MTNYPEHEKLKAIQEQSQAIGEFLDWLEDEQLGGDYGCVQLAYRPFITERAIYKDRKKPFDVSGYEPIPRDEWKRSNQLESLTYNKQKLLAKFFNIDLNKLEEEKRAMLDECRKLHAGKPHDLSPVRPRRSPSL